MKVICGKCHAINPEFSTECHLCKMAFSRLNFTQASNTMIKDALKKIDDKYPSISVDQELFDNEVLIQKYERVLKAIANYSLSDSDLEPVQDAALLISWAQRALEE